MTLYHWFWLVSIMVSVLYAALILYLWMGWNRTKPFQAQPKTHHTKVSVVVPFHNEVDSLKQCIDGLMNQQIQTTFFEIILVDDHSTDGSSELASQIVSDSPVIKYVQNSTKGKKAALETGISNTQGEFIVTTDADCVYPLNWLSTLVDYYETHHPNLIIGPMELKTGNSFFQKFQALEYLSLMGSTAGAAGMGRAVMCNGANLAFKKEVYEQFPNPFKREYASGDDVFLLHQFKELNAIKVHYLKSDEAVVLTSGINGFREYLNQRFRWTSKAPGYKDTDTIVTAALVFGISALLTAGMVLSPFFHSILIPLCIMYGIKTIVDFCFFYRVAPFFGKKNLLGYVPFFEVLYAIYVTVSGLSVFFTGRLRKN
ncbi:MAG: glycosyltransferase [Salinivirgaceae bacterium]